LVASNGEHPERKWRNLGESSKAVFWTPLIEVDGRRLYSAHNENCEALRPQSVFECMVMDHVHIHQIAEEMNQSVEAEEWGDLSPTVSFFHAMLKRHIEFEEEILLPLLAQRYASPRGPAYVLGSEHRWILTSAAELEELVRHQGRPEIIRNRTRALTTYLVAHAAREEDLLYALVDAQLTSDERESLVTFFDDMVSNR